MKATGIVRRIDSSVILGQNSTVSDKRIEDLTREELIRLWIEEGKSDSMIAEQLHTTVYKVRQRRKELDVFLGCTADPLENLSVPELLQLQIAICRELEQRLRDQE